jgi:hypothetical protein
MVLYRKESATIQFTVTYKADDSAVDCSSATFSFSVKRRVTDADSTVKIQKADASFDKTNAATGIVTLPLLRADTDLTPAPYVAQLEIDFGVGNRPFSDLVALEIKTPVIPL